jgi:hypothetical protein
MPAGVPHTAASAVKLTRSDSADTIYSNFTRGYFLMVFFILILLLITFSGSRLYGPEKFNNDYLEKHSTAAVNGIFVMLVLLYK